MKKNILFIPWILICNTPFILCAMQPEFHVHINTHIDGSRADASAATSHHEQTQLLHDSWQSMTSKLAEMQNVAPNYVNGMWQNKYKIILATIGASYLYVCYELHATHVLLQNPNSWCNWKEAVSIQQLVCTPHQELIPDLLANVQKKYLLTTKAISPMLKASLFDQFIDDVSRELYALQRYIIIKKWVKSLYAKRLFYFSYKKSIIEEKISRLHVMLDVFVTWQTKDLLK